MMWLLMFPIFAVFPVPARGFSHAHVLRRRVSQSEMLSTSTDFHQASRICENSEILKPVLDDKLYRVIELDNGLRVMLVSDKRSDVSGAAMNIHCGSFQDPEDFAGLAHFHEHMLFLGTEKYPGEDEYDSFLSGHGGFSNAYTADEDTNCGSGVNVLPVEAFRNLSFLKRSP